jgi:hypothetical protein
MQQRAIRNEQKTKKRRGKIKAGKNATREMSKGRREKAGKVSRVPCV